MQRNILPNQQPNQPPPQPPEPRYRFRWSIYIGVPLVIAVFLWLLKGADISFSFKDIMRSLNVAQEERYIRLACLGTLLIVITLIVKSFRNHSR